MKITVEHRAGGENEVVLSKELAEKSKKPLDAMLRLVQAKEGEKR